MPSVPAVNRRNVIIAAVIAVILIAIWWVRDRRPGVQVPATFAAIEQALADGSSGGVMARIHRDYPYRRRWPGRFDDMDAAADRDPRALAAQGLRMVLLAHRQDPLRLTWKVDAIEPQTDGTVVARVTLGMASDGGGSIRIDPPVDRHRFVLRRAGWFWPALQIVDHDPIAIAGLR